MGEDQTDEVEREPRAPSAGESAELAEASSDGAERVEQVAARIEEIPAADGAAVLENLPADKAADVAEYLDPQTAGAILSEMDPQRAATILSDMEAPEASRVVSAMAPDDRVDVLEYLGEADHDAIVGELDAEDAADVLALERYAPDSAGGIMTTDVVALAEDLTIEEAVVELRRISEEREQLWYVYIVDRRHHLVGVLSIRDLILSRPGRRLGQIMRRQVFTVLATADQEEVAWLFRRYNYLAMPVVDARRRLVGLITFDDAADVIEEEATEDVQKMFGAGAGERLASPWRFAFRKRIGWLVVKLLAVAAPAAIVAAFDSSLASIPVLAAFGLIVAGVGRTGGSQALSVAIRGIAASPLDADPKTLYRNLYRALAREAIVGLLSGLILAVVAGAIVALGAIGHRSLFPYRPLRLAGVVAIATAATQWIACMTGVALPFAMKRLRLDPAQSATVWAAVVTDCFGYFVTFGLAELCMKWLR